jgi:protein gp37
MAEHSAIEWTDATWNPTRGCTKISPGCTHCYAETFAERFRGVPGHPYEQGFDLRLVPDKLQDPIGWKKPRMIFVNSMSDLFHEDIPDEFIDQVFGVMGITRRHTYQVLTKRGERMRDYFNTVGKTRRLLEAQREMAKGHGGDLMNRAGMSMWPLPNVWFGVSVENRKHGLPRIEHLRSCSVGRGPVGPTVRFLSIEPLLEDLGPIDLTGIGWVIVGGESGHGARPMHPEWVRSIRDQCVAAGVPFFFKQWGEWAEDTGQVNEQGRDPWPHTWIDQSGSQWGGFDTGRIRLRRFGKRFAGRLFDGREWNEMPEVAH